MNFVMNIMNHSLITILTNFDGFSGLLYQLKL